MVCLWEVEREEGGRGHQRHRNLANLVLISGPQITFLRLVTIFFATENSLFQIELYVFWMRFDEAEI